MPNHVKPTQEELDANIAKAKADLEQIDKEEAEAVEEIKEKVEEKPVEKVTPLVEKPEVTPVEKAAEVTPVEKVEEKPVEPTKEEIDYRQKFVGSTREAQILAAKNKQIQEAIAAAGTLPQPNEEEVKREYPEWEEMSAVEKRLATTDLWNRQKFDAINKASEIGKNIDEWNKKVDDFVANPTTLVNIPELEGKQDEFKNFAARETRRGVDFDTLVSAFLFEVDKAKPAPKKGQMFERGTGGPNEKANPVIKTDKLSVEESEVLREKDYKKYREMLQAGKIATEIIE